MIEREILLSLNRNIYLEEDGIIHVETEEAQGFEYAFYLYNGKDLEKEFYKDRKSFIFSKKIQNSGFFTVSFFYRKKNTAEILQISEKYYFNKEICKAYKFEPEKVFEDKYTKIDYYDIGSEITFIVFNGGGASKNSPPFGLYFLIEQGFNVIACSHENNLYQGLSFLKFEHLVGPYIVGKTVFLYGSSLGAYAALYYSGAVDGTVIAAAPRNSIHPLLKSSLDKSEKAKVKFTHSSFNEIKKTSKDLYIFLDKFQLADVYFYNEAIAPFFEKINLIYVDYAGHELLYHLNNTKQLKKIVLDIIDGKTPVVCKIKSQYTDLGLIKMDYQLEKFHEVIRSAEIFLENNTYEDKLKKEVLKFLENSKKRLN